MFCTKRTKCKFVVWTGEGTDNAIVDINYNDDYVQQLLPRIRNIFFESLLVRLTDEIHFNRLLLSPEFSQLASIKG